MVKKMKTSKKTAEKSWFFRFWNKYWQLITVTVLVLGIFGFIGVNKLIVYNQKKQFDAAEASLDKLYADIVAQVGQPTTVKKDNYCSYRSVEWGQGERNCSVGIVFVISGVGSREDAKNLASKIDGIISANSSSYATDILHEDGYVDKYMFSASLNFTDNTSRLACYVSYSYNLVDSAEHNSLKVVLSCYGHPYSEFYPVKN